MYNFRSETMVNTIGLKGKNQVGLYVNDVLTYYFYQTDVGGVQPVIADRWVVEATAIGEEITLPMYSAMKGFDLNDRVNVDWMSVRSAMEQLSLSALMHLTQEWHDNGMAEPYFAARQTYQLYGKLECGIWRGFNFQLYRTNGQFTGDCFNVSTDRTTRITRAELLEFYRDGLQVPGISEFMLIQGPSAMGQLCVSNNTVVVKQTVDTGTQTDTQDVGVG